MNFPPSIILVNPQMGENIGAAARAMFNFGLSDLRLINPRDGWPNQAAIDNAAGAFNQIPAPQIFESFEDGVKDLHYLAATTARSRSLAKTVLSPDQASTQITTRQASGQKCGLVFGAERTGLENEHIALCHTIINIPANPDFSSLNLAQAVLLMAYSWFKHAQEKEISPAQSHLDENLPAAQEHMNELLRRLEEELTQANFFRDEGLKPTMIKNIHTMLTRAEMTDQEVRTFHGIISALIGKKSSQNT